MGKRISDEKLYSSFNKVNTLELDYVQKAKQLAERIAKYGADSVTSDELASVRLAAVNDRKNLKGDFVISCFLDVIQQESKFKRWEKGKSIDITQKDARKIFHNYFSKELSVTDYCKLNRLTRTKYYRIVNCDVKNVEYKQELERIKNEVAKEYNM